jgi:hypothetical protein
LDNFWSFFPQFFTCCTLDYSRKSVFLVG